MREIACLLLAAGIGSRLKPYTDILPKCLMPINGKPLLEIWLDSLISIGFKKILVNIHHHKDQVIEFLTRPDYRDYIDYVFEPKLLGTAGTLKNNFSYFRNKTILLIHGDNLCECDLDAFIDFHIRTRPRNTLMTMMTFISPTPETCGIVELDKKGVVQKFHEKVNNPPSNLANAAIYLLEPEVLEWIMQKEGISDFSMQVLPFFMGRIATWKNEGVMRDIGTPQSLKLAQTELQPSTIKFSDEWAKKYKDHPIHNLIK